MAPRWLTIILVKGFGFKRLRGANLSGADLSGARLWQANLTDANLVATIGADLSGAILE